ncbi:multiple epidermal growth factor-like domains protein 10, partial [Saccostrea cucullata]|uniref:multiple epidermal growth factor-like domains protein 10 n=1 Tax=Saccostrea cuccullata TaxID=36930 RepID=UPI002ED224FD
SDSQTYGGDYIEKCSGNCLNGETCDRFTGKCSSCSAGWKGPMCNISCENGEYGKDCLEDCNENCLNGETCDRFFGNCSNCSAGSKGPMCNVSCDSGEYGRDCLEKCSGNCLNGETCDRFTGECSSCSAGWKGPMCNISCHSGEYGKDCLEKCSGNCFNGDTCDRFNGSCNNCSDLWKGVLCNTSVCLPGTYMISDTECHKCPIGEFQDEIDRTSCKKCPLEQNTTETTGARSESYCIASCEDGTEFNRNSRTCKECPKDFYTNRSISEYCIMCPTGYITNGSKSASCFKRQENITSTPIPPKEQKYSFNLKYRANVNCSDEEAKNALLQQIRKKVIGRLIELAKQYPSMCNRENVSECFQSVKIGLKACKATNRKKRSMDSFGLDITGDIQVKSPTVTDSNKPAKIVQTETVLQEDIDTQKTEYSPQGVTLIDSTYMGKI